MSAGQTIEIYKETGRPRAVRRAVRPRRAPGHARARPHAHGDREPRHDRGLTPVLDRARPLPRAQRLALQPQPAPRAFAARGDRVPDRERHRGRRRATWPGACARAPRSERRSRAASMTWTASTPSWSGPIGRLRRPARPDRVQAGGDRRDGRLGGDGVGVARDRRPPRLERRPDAGSRRPASSMPGSGQRSDGDRDGRIDGGRGRRSRRRPRCASSTSGCTTWPRRSGAAPVAGAQPERRARRRLRDRRRRSRSRSRATSATTAPA